MTAGLILEVCLDSLVSLEHAVRAGADRLELCRSLDQDGLTPEPSLLAAARQSASCPLFAMLRPRPGDFCFDAAERRQIFLELDRLRAAGVDGIVFGALTESGEIDRDLCQQVVEGCHPYPVTFHRAFDLVRDWEAALETVTELGFARILSSGAAPRAALGTQRLAALVKAARGRLTIVAGGGVRTSDVSEIVSKTGVSELHSSAREPGSPHVSPGAVRRLISECRLAESS